MHNVSKEDMEIVKTLLPMVLMCDDKFYFLDVFKLYEDNYVISYVHQTDEILIVEQGKIEETVSKIFYKIQTNLNIFIPKN